MQTDSNSEASDFGDVNRAPATKPTIHNNHITM
jgi:hypothetical protein